MSKTIKMVYREDKLARVGILASGAVPTPLFSFYEETWKEYENDGTGEPYSLWLPTYGSGYYDSAEAVEAEARSMFPWFAAAASD